MEPTLGDSSADRPTPTMQCICSLLVRGHALFHRPTLRCQQLSRSVKSTLVQRAVLRVTLAAQGWAGPSRHPPTDCVLSLQPFLFFDPRSQQPASPRELMKLERSSLVFANQSEALHLDSGLASRMLKPRKCSLGLHGCTAPRLHACSCAAAGSSRGPKPAIHALACVGASLQQHAHSPRTRAPAHTQ